MARNFGSKGKVSYSSIEALVNPPKKQARSKYRAVRTTCRASHLHDSKTEAARCDELSLMEKAGLIVGLEQQPEFKFVINGRPVMLDNGQCARIRADFSYIENGVKVVEDRKGFVVRDFPLRWALARTLWPDLDWRVTK